MRLVSPTLHRAFPVLDRFDDHQGEALLRRAARLGSSPTPVAIASGVLVFLLWLTLVYGFGPTLGQFFGSMPRSMVRLLSVLLGPYLGAALAAGAGLLVRDRVIERRLLRWLGPPPRCLGCGYRLDGLSSAPCCPECGREIDRTEV
ncbi:MAG: hypothetical protein AAGG07_10905 [Planctomycetota bacterium]